MFLTKGLWTSGNDGVECNRETPPEMWCPDTGMQQCQEDKKKESGSLGPSNDLKPELKPTGRGEREISTQKEEVANSTCSLSPGSW